MNEEQLKELFEYSMRKEGYSGGNIFTNRDGHYVLDDIREMFRGFKLGWKASCYLADIEIGIQHADAGRLTSSEDVRTKWENRES